MMDFDAAQSLVADPILSGSNTARVILAVGPLAAGVKKETLEIGVHNAALSFAMARKPIEPQQRVDDAEALADACRMVLVSLGLTVEGRRKDKTARLPVKWKSIRRSLGPGALYTGGESVLSAISAVQDLEGMAERIAAHYRDKAKGRSKARGAPKNRALGPLFDCLECLYLEIWGEMPALTRSSTRGDWREAEQAEGVVEDAYASGNELPTRFLRFLCEVFPLMASRGLDVPTGDAAIEQACRRWRKRQSELAAVGEGEESIYNLGKRLAGEVPR